MLDSVKKHIGINLSLVRRSLLIPLCFGISSALYAQQHLISLVDDFGWVALHQSVTEQGPAGILATTSCLPFIVGGYTSQNGAAPINQPGELPEASFSLLDISDPDVLLWSLKPAEEGSENGGLVTRVWNLSQEDRPTIIDFTADVLRADKATHVETETGPATVAQSELQATIGRQRKETFRLYLDTITDIENPTGPAVCVTDIQVFPNPVAGTVKIQLPPGIGKVSVKIIDLSGKELTNRTLTGTFSQMDTSIFPSGLYLWVFEGSEFRITKKVKIK